MPPPRPLQPVLRRYGRPRKDVEREPQVPCNLRARAYQLRQFVHVIQQLHPPRLRSHSNHPGGLGLNLALHLWWRRQRCGAREYLGHPPGLHLYNRDR